MQKMTLEFPHWSIGIEGRLKELGTGKTAFLTGLGYRAFCRGRKIAANYHLQFRYTPVTTVEQLNSLRDCVFLGDELWSWCRSRKRGSDINEVLDEILLSARKRRCSVYYTQQVDTLMERPVREVTNEWVYTHVKQRIGTLPGGLPQYKWVIGEFLRTGYRMRFNFEEIGALYDTHEEVRSLAKDEEFYKERVLLLRADQTFLNLRREKSKIQHVINRWRMIERDAYYLLDLVESDLWLNTTTNI